MGLKSLEIRNARNMSQRAIVAALRAAGFQIHDQDREEGPNGEKRPGQTWSSPLDQFVAMDWHDEGSCTYSQFQMPASWDDPDLIFMSIVNDPNDFSITGEFEEPTIVSCEKVSKTAMKPD